MGQVARSVLQRERKLVVVAGLTDDRLLGLLSLVSVLTRGSEWLLLSTFGVASLRSVTLLRPVHLAHQVVDPRPADPLVGLTCGSILQPLGVVRGRLGVDCVSVPLVSALILERLFDLKLLRVQLLGGVQRASLLVLGRLFGIEVDQGVHQLLLLLGILSFRSSAGKSLLILGGVPSDEFVLFAVGGRQVGLLPAGLNWHSIVLEVAALRAHRVDAEAFLVQQSLGVLRAQVLHLEGLVVRVRLSNLLPYKVMKPIVSRCTFLRSFRLLLLASVVRELLRESLLLEMALDLLPVLRLPLEPQRLFKITVRVGHAFCGLKLVLFQELAQIELLVKVLRLVELALTLSRFEDELVVLDLIEASGRRAMGHQLLVGLSLI